jgi:hypothetical protein
MAPAMASSREDGITTAPSLKGTGVDGLSVTTERRELQDGGQRAGDRQVLAEVGPDRHRGTDEASLRDAATPTGVPPEVLDRLVSAGRRAVESAEFRLLATRQAPPLRFLDHDAHRAELLGLRARLQHLGRAHARRD